MHILLLHLGSIKTAPRPRRMLDACRSLGFRVSCMCSIGGSASDAAEIYELPMMPRSMLSRLARKCISFFGGLLTLLSFDMEQFYRFMFQYNDHVDALLQKKYDLIIVENLELLPLAFKVPNGAKVLFDAREYYPKEFEDSLTWQLTQRLLVTAVCRKYLSQCDAVITVSSGLSNEYRKEFNINPVLVRSVPFYSQYSVRPTSEDVIRMVHHGVANEDRKLEKMIALFSTLDQRFSLDFYLTGNSVYIERLVEIARPYEDRIRFLSPVPYDGILAMLNEYDIGLYLLTPTGFNTRHALPNKFFEFIQARLAVVIGPSPDMAELVKQYGCGAISDDFKPMTMASLLNNLSADDINRMKMASDMAARKLCYEEEQKKLVEVLNELAAL